MSFDSLGLSADILRAVAEEGYDTPTPIQAQAIPVVLRGHDLLAGAQTGTGKTAGFTLPILHLLSTTPPADKTRIRALILTPTRELAAQVEESVRTYGKHLKLTSMVMFGGVSINPQIKALKHRIDILVATPGRLLDHVGQGTIDLSSVEILVLDEADRMLDMGFIRDIRKILALLPEKRQNLLFSATFSDEIRELAHSFLKEPEQVEVARRNTTVESVAQRVYTVDREQKRALLIHLIKENNWFQVLVFTRTKHGANALADKLNKAGITALAIHGNKSQNARTRALSEFKSGDLQVLVATDIAARGLDIEELPHVVNYELPNVPEDYVHRIGRTGRAGATGEAVSLVCADEAKLLRDIEKLIKRDIEKSALPGFEPDPNRPAEPEPAREPRNNQNAGKRKQAQPQGAKRQQNNPEQRQPRSKPKAENRQGESRQAEARQGENRQGENRQGESRQGEGRQGEGRNGNGRQGNPRQGGGGNARQGENRQGQGQRQGFGDKPKGNGNAQQGQRGKQGQQRQGQGQGEANGNKAPQGQRGNSNRARSDAQPFYDEYTRPPITLTIPQRQPDLTGTTAALLGGKPGGKSGGKPGGGRKG